MAYRKFIPSRTTAQPYLYILSLQRVPSKQFSYFQGINPPNCLKLTDTCLLFDSCPVPYALIMCASPSLTRVGSFCLAPTICAAYHFLYILGTSEWVSGGVSADLNEVQPVQPPSIAQAFLTGLRGRIADCGYELQQTFQDAKSTADDPAMEHYRLAAEYLEAAQHTATSVSTPLALAEHHYQAFKAAVEKKSRFSMESAAGKSQLLLLAFRRFHTHLVPPTFLFNNAFADRVSPVIVDVECSLFD